MLQLLPGHVLLRWSSLLRRVLTILLDLLKPLGDVRRPLRQDPIVLVLDLLLKLSDLLLELLKAEWGLLFSEKRVLLRNHLNLITMMARKSIGFMEGLKLKLQSM